MAIIPSLRAEPGVVISLPRIAERVRAENPDLAAARLRIQEAVGRHVQSGRLSNPELETEVSHDPRFRERGVQIGFTQRFPLTHRLSLEKEVSAKEVQAAQAEIQEVERRITAEAREGVVKVLAIREKRRLLTGQGKLLRELADSLGDASRKGEGSPLDAGQARLEAASLEMEIRQLDAGEAATVGGIKPLLGMRPEETLFVSGALPEPVLPKANPDISARPDLQAAKLSAQAAGRGVALEQSRRYEDVEAGLFAGANRTEDVPQGYDTEATVGFRFRIPLPLWNKNEGAIYEAQARRERLEKETIALARNISLEAESARREMEQWAAMISEIGTGLLPLAQEQSDLAEQALLKGQGEIQAVLRSREKQVQLATAKLDALREFNLARVRYDAAIGKQ